MKTSCDSTGEGQSNNDTESFGGDATSKSPTKACPMCGAQIDSTWFIGWRLGRRSSYRHKENFCQVHTRGSAEIEWKKQGYPEIKWGRLQRRFRRFHPVLNKIISKGVGHN